MDYTLGVDTATGMVDVDSPYYRELSATIVRRIAGVHDIGKAFGIRYGNRDYFYHQAVQSLIDNNRPVNRLERSWIGYTKTEAGNTWIEYVARQLRVNYRPWSEYVFSLDNEYDPIKFLKLLLLHESAGLSIESMDRVQYDFRSGLSASPDLPSPPRCVDILRYTLPNDRKRVIIPQGEEYFRYTPSLVIPWYDRKAPSATTWGDQIDDKPDWNTVNRIRYTPYSGYDPAMVYSFLVQVERFRERVFAEMLGTTFFMLDVAHLADQGAVETMWNYFTKKPFEIFNKISMPEQITVLSSAADPTGETRYVWPCGFSMPEFQKAQIVKIDKAGKVVSMTIADSLRAQFEACVWIVICNKVKLDSRIAQLRDKTAELKAMVPIPWQYDPWTNPYLIYDPDRMQFVNVAQAQAYTTTVPIVSPVPIKYVKQAPEIEAEFLRNLRLPGGATYSLRDVAAKDEKSSLPLILAAVAATAVLYVQLR